MKEIELINETNERNNEIVNATYYYILTLLEKDENDFEFDMAVVGGVLEATIETLWKNHGLKVRWPSVVTEEDGSQHYSEYDYGEEGR